MGLNMYKVVYELKDNFICSYQPFNKYSDALRFIIDDMKGEDNFIKQAKIVNIETKLVVASMTKCERK